jgi:hypothetical protein
VFFLAGMKAQRGDGGGRILLGDNTGRGIYPAKYAEFKSPPKLSFIPMV